MRVYACIYYCVRSVSSSNLCTAAAAAAAVLLLHAHSVFVLGSLNAFAFCFRGRGVVCIVDRCRCFLKSLGFRLVLLLLLLFLLLSFVVYTLLLVVFFSRLLLFNSSMACRSGCIHACGRFLFYFSRSILVFALSLSTRSACLPLLPLPHKLLTSSVCVPTNISLLFKCCS